MTNNIFSKLRGLYNRKIMMPGVDIGALQKRCTMSEKSYINEIKSLGGEHVIIPLDKINKHSRKTSSEVPYYLYLDNGADILAVAHLDTVLPENRQKFSSRVYKDKKANSKDVEQKVVVSSELDDRLGAYIIMDYLPKFGLNYDILLTTNEESGNTTAEYFETTKEYKWIFEFDRAGTDLVMYRYEHKELKDIMDEFFTIGVGSFTDICKLTHLGAAAFNVGCGYQRPHTPECFVFLSDIQTQVRKFLGFWEKYHNITLPFKLASETSRWRNGYYDDDYAYGYGGGTKWPSTPSTSTSPNRIMKTSFGEWEQDKVSGAWTFIRKTQEGLNKRKFCFITLRQFPAEEITIQELDNFQVVQFHKSFLTLDMYTEGIAGITHEKYKQLEIWFNSLTPTEQRRYVNEFIMGNQQDDYDNSDGADVDDYGDDYRNDYNTPLITPDEEIDDDSTDHVYPESSVSKMEKKLQNNLMNKIKKNGNGNWQAMADDDKVLCEVCGMRYEWYNIEAYVDEFDDDSPGICHGCYTRLMEQADKRKGESTNDNSAE